MPEPCMLVSQTAYHTEGQFGRSQLVQLGMCGEICDPVFSTKSVFLCHYRVGAGAYEQVVIKR